MTTLIGRSKRIHIQLRDPDLAKTKDKGTKKATKVSQGLTVYGLELDEVFEIIQDALTKKQEKAGA